MMEPNFRIYIIFLDLVRGEIHKTEHCKWQDNNLFSSGTCKWTGTTLAVVLILPNISSQEKNIIQPYNWERKLALKAFNMLAVRGNEKSGCETFTTTKCIPFIIMKFYMYKYIIIYNLFFLFSFTLNTVYKDLINYWY